MKNKQRSGIGYDVHPLVPGRRLVLGGVDIPFDKGLKGWSDADTLTHAIMDALLGAAGLGDIGMHYPSGERQYKDISSLALLKMTGDKLKEKGWLIGNIDAIIIAEQPKLQGFFERMKQKLSQALGVTPDQVNIKATTSEGLGFIGRGEGIAAWAVASIEGIAET